MGQSTPPRDTPEIGIVLVNYRSKHHIAELLAMWGAAFPVTVVDNSANSDGIKELLAATPVGHYVDGGGQGFARAANIGALASATPFVVFVNPDSRPTVDHITALVEGLRHDPQALSHAATMMRADGETEMGVGGWEPTLRRVLVYSLVLHKWFPEAGFFARPTPGHSVTVDWTTGACMAVDMAKFRSIGGFDEMFYVYAEDMSLGRRARLAGLRQVLRADVRVPHGAGNSGAPAKEMLQLRGASFANYMLSYHPPLRAHGVLLTMSAGYLARGIAGARREKGSLQRHLAFVRGTTTRRARVGGVEVAHARLVEVSAGLPHRKSVRGLLSLGRAA